MNYQDEEMGSSRTNKLIDSISSIKDEFYSSTRKKIFMTSSQKKECAEYITSKLSLDDLINNTIYIVRENIIYVEYPLFKQFASPSNYSYILNKLFDRFKELIDKYKSFEFHINLSSFSISAMERYKDFLKLYFDTYYSSNIDYGFYMKNMYIYNTPSVINTVITVLQTYARDSKLQRAPIKDKIIMFSKSQTQDKLYELLGNNYQQENDANNS